MSSGRSDHRPSPGSDGHYDPPYDPPFDVTAPGGTGRTTRRPLGARAPAPAPASGPEPSGRASAPAPGDRPRRARDGQGDRPGHGQGQPGRGPQRPTCRQRRGRRGLRAQPPHLPPRRQRRRRRSGRDLARHDGLLPGADQRRPGPGGALPRPDDVAVRDRRAADRTVPRPVQPRPPLGHRFDLRPAGVPLLGARRGRGGRLPLALPRRARRARLVQGVRRDARGRDPPAAAGEPHAREGQRPGVALRRGRAPRSPHRSRGWRGLLRARVVAAPRLLDLRRRHDRAILLPSKVDSSEGEQQVSMRPDAGRAGRRGTTSVPGRGVRAARQLRTALALGLPHDVHGLPAARAPAGRLGGQGGAAARHRDRRRGRRQHHRDLRRLAC